MSGARKMGRGNHLLNVKPRWFPASSAGETPAPSIKKACGGLCGLLASRVWGCIGYYDAARLGRTRVDVDREFAGAVAARASRRTGGREVSAAQWLSDRCAEFSRGGGGDRSRGD